MKSTPELLEAVKRQHGLTSDYQLARHLGIDRALVSAYRTGRRKLTEADCLRVADALEVERAAVLAAVQLERSTDDETRKVWREAIKKLGGLAAGLLLALGGGPTPPPASAAAVHAAVQGGPLCIMLNKKRRKKPRAHWSDTIARALAFPVRMPA